MTKKKYRPDIVSPPGNTLKEFLEEWGISIEQLAEMMEYPIEIIDRVINHGDAMSKAFIMSLSFCKMKNARGSFDFWTKRNADYVKWLERRDEANKKG